MNKCKELNGIIFWRQRYCQGNKQSNVACDEVFLCGREITQEDSMHIVYLLLIIEHNLALEVMGN